MTVDRSPGRRDSDGIVHEQGCLGDIGAQGRSFQSIAELRAASGVHVGRTPEGHLIYTCTTCGARAIWAVNEGHRTDRVPDPEGDAGLLRMRERKYAPDGGTEPRPVDPEYAEGHVIGLIDFEAHELAGGRLRDIWDVQDLDAPIPEEVRAEVAAATGVRPEDVRTLPVDHPWRLAHDRARGSGTWPEWLGARAHEFTVELEPGGRAPGRRAIRALVHKTSGHRRERAPVEAAIADRIASPRGSRWLNQGDEPRASHAATPDQNGGGPHSVAAYISDLVGGPGRPLRLDDQGRTITEPLPPPPDLPSISAETFRVRG